MEENNATTSSKKGKGLGTAGMVIGIVAIVWAIIPLVGAAAWWLALVGLVLSLVAFFMAKGGGNTKRGGMMAGIILNAVALALAIFWIYKIASGLSELKDGFEDMAKSLDTAAIRQSLESAIENATDSTAH
jgi:uncharacterized membrane protein YphA (DoxX/SURF4 family)